MKPYFKLLSVKRRPFCSGLNVLKGLKWVKPYKIDAETKCLPFCRRHFQAHFLIWKLLFRFKFHWNLFPRFQLTTFHHWFRQWLGADQATSHYLDQWWPCLLTHICVNRPQWVNKATHNKTFINCDWHRRYTYQVNDQELNERHNTRVSFQKGPTRHAYAWQIGPFWQDALDYCQITNDFPRKN